MFGFPARLGSVRRAGCRGEVARSGGKAARTQGASSQDRFGRGSDSLVCCANRPRPGGSICRAIPTSTGLIDSCHSTVLSSNLRRDRDRPRIRRRLDHRSAPANSIRKSCRLKQAKGEVLFRISLGQACKLANRESLSESAPASYEDVPAIERAIKGNETFARRVVGDRLGSARGIAAR